MGVTTNYTEFSLSVAPKRLFHAFFVDAPNFMPKALPQVIKSVDIVSGSGGPGSVEQINYTDVCPFTHALHRLDAIDWEAYSCEYSVFGGDALGEKYELITFVVKIVPTEDGAGCTVQITSNHHNKGDAEVSNEEIMDAKEKSIGMYKAVENFLNENPTIYA